MAKIRIIVKRRHQIKSILSKVGSNAGEKKRDKNLFCAILSRIVHLENARALLPCLVHFYRQKGCLHCELYSTGRVESFGYWAVCDLSSQLRGDIFAPVTSKLPLVY